MGIVEALLSYIISIAAGFTTEALQNKKKKELLKQLEREAEALQKIKDRKTLEQELLEIGENAAEMKLPSGITDAGKPLFGLITNKAFPKMVSTWLTAIRPEEKKEAESQLSIFLAKELEKEGADVNHIEKFKASYFDRIEKTVFSNPILSNWRTNLALNIALEKLDELDELLRQEGLDTRREVLLQHEETRALTAKLAAEKAHGESERFSQELRHKALLQYKKLALESCDIIDLANLPEGDRHLATRQLELRRLYVPLRIKVEFSAQKEPDELALTNIEKQRDLLRQRKKHQEEQDNIETLASVGHRLEEAERLVLLGDPGAGKTTIIRWIATAYHLRLKHDPAFKDLPDVATLPDREWLPIVVRCRDLGEAGRTGTLDEILEETFRKAQMAEDEAAALPAVMRELLAEGKAILLVDGLDEISEPGVRSRFCQQVERLHIAYPDAPMIVTSRIVGYREMRYRIGRGFEHATVAEFSKEDKDEFARRWCAITELPERREKAAGELIKDIHSADRIERLTSNPMLLTTMALVKRKVGKLPSRRAELYWEAVMVLLNWRSEVDEPIDHREAIPQLQYVAYEMCRRGIQRLREEEILELMERMRKEYPNVRAVKKHEPLEFLHLLERRTGIIIEAGEVKFKGRPAPVFEFRHLTFQEYLAALALVDGRFPGRDKNKSLAEQIAPLAGQMEEVSGETVVKENWREVLRLCVACCGDDDVDDVLSAILKPLKGEDRKKTPRPRAVLATLCLSDEPNASDEAAQEVLRVFAENVMGGDGGGRVTTAVDHAAMELVGSEWEGMLRFVLLDEFCSRAPLVRRVPGSLLSMIGAASAPKDAGEFQQWFENLVGLLNSGIDADAIGASLYIMQMAYKNYAILTPGMIEGLLLMLDRDAPSAHACTWALGWLVRDRTWIPGQKEIVKLISFIDAPSSDIKAVYEAIVILGEVKDSRVVEPLIAKLEDQNDDVRRAASVALKQIGDPRAVEPLITKLEDQNGDVRDAAYSALGRIGAPRAVEPLIAKLDNQDDVDREYAASALGQIGDPHAVEPLLVKLEDQNEDVRQSALGALAKICEEEIDRILLSMHFGGAWYWIDPQVPIDKKRIEEAAKELSLSTDEVRSRYERLAEKYGLKLEI